MKDLARSHGTLIGSRAFKAGSAQTKGGTRLRGVSMLDLLMLALGAASFALLARYLILCERG
jgi:hypothetical protein